MYYNGQDEGRQNNQYYQGGVDMLWAKVTDALVPL